VGGQGTRKETHTPQALLPMCSGDAVREAPQEKEELGSTRVKSVGSRTHKSTTQREHASAARGEAGSPMLEARMITSPGSGTQYCFLLLLVPP
jgi:hypothetical protein